MGCGQIGGVGLEARETKWNPWSERQSSEKGGEAPSSSKRSPAARARPERLVAVPHTLARQASDLQAGKRSARRRGAGKTRREEKEKRRKGCAECVSADPGKGNGGSEKGENRTAAREEKQPLGLKRCDQTSHHQGLLGNSRGGTSCGTSKPSTSFVLTTSGFRSGSGDQPLGSGKIPLLSTTRKSHMSLFPPSIRGPTTVRLNKTPQRRKECLHRTRRSVPRGIPRV